MSRHGAARIYNFLCWRSSLFWFNHFCLLSLSTNLSVRLYGCACCPPPSSEMKNSLLKQTSPLGKLTWLDVTGNEILQNMSQDKTCFLQYFSATSSHKKKACTTSECKLFIFKKEHWQLALDSETLSKDASSKLTTEDINNVNPFLLSVWDLCWPLSEVVADLLANLQKPHLQNSYRKQQAPKCRTRS